LIPVFSLSAFGLSSEEYINRVNQLIFQQENMLDRANRVLKDIQKEKNSEEHLRKYFEIISQSEAMIEETTLLDAPELFYGPHISLILYIKWINLALYEVLNDEKDDKSKFCLDRANLYIKKFEKSVGTNLLLKRNKKLELEKREKTKQKNK
jgi:hypothetical protein